jgi:hypothetical protein
MLSTEPETRFEAPERLFDAQSYRLGSAWRGYDVTSDDLSFVMLRGTGAGPSEAGGLVIVENWFEELREAAPR